MPPETRAAVASVRVVKRHLTSGDWRVDETHEVRLCDKVRALEDLEKHFGLLVEKVEHTGGVDLVTSPASGSDAREAMFGEASVISLGADALSVGLGWQVASWTEIM
jgi:hypothetical protein